MAGRLRVALRVGGGQLVARAELLGAHAPAQHAERLELAGLPVLHELPEVHVQPVPRRAHGQAHGGRGLALAVSGVHLYLALLHVASSRGASACALSHLSCLRVGRAGARPRAHAPAPAAFSPAPLVARLSASPASALSACLSSKPSARRQACQSPSSRSQSKSGGGASGRSAAPSSALASSQPSHWQAPMSTCSSSANATPSSSSISRCTSGPPNA